MNNTAKIQNTGQQFCQKGLDEWDTLIFAPDYKRVTLRLVEKCPLPGNEDAGPGYEKEEEEVSLENFDSDTIISGIKGISLNIQHEPSLPGLTGNFNITCGQDTDQGVAWGQIVSDAICHDNRICLERGVIWKNGKTFGELEGEATNCPPCGQRSRNPYCAYDCCNSPGQRGEFGCSDGGNAMSPVVQDACPQHGKPYIVSNGAAPEQKRQKIEGIINSLMQVDCNRKVDQKLAEFRAFKKPSKFSRGSITVKVEAKGNAKCYVDEAEQTKEVSHIGRITISRDGNVATVESVPVLKSYKMDPFTIEFVFGGTCKQNLRAVNNKLSRTNPMRLPKVYGSVVYGFPCYDSRIFPDPTGESPGKNYTIQYNLDGVRQSSVTKRATSRGAAIRELQGEFPGQVVRIVSCTESAIPSFDGIQYDNKTKKYTFRAFSPDAKTLKDTLGNKITCGEAHLWSQLRTNQLDDVLDVTECYQPGVVDRQACIQRILTNAALVKPLETLDGDNIISPIVTQVQNAIVSAMNQAIAEVNRKGNAEILNMCGVQNCASGVEIVSVKLHSIDFPNT